MFLSTFAAMFSPVKCRNWPCRCLGSSKSPGQALEIIFWLFLRNLMIQMRLNQNTAEPDILCKSWSILIKDFLLFLKCSKTSGCPESFHCIFPNIVIIPLLLTNSIYKRLLNFLSWGSILVHLCLSCPRCLLGFSSSLSVSILEKNYIENYQPWSKIPCHKAGLVIPSRLSSPPAHTQQNLEPNHLDCHPWTLLDICPQANQQLWLHSSSLNKSKIIFKMWQ